MKPERFVLLGFGCCCVEMLLLPEREMLLLLGGSSLIVRVARSGGEVDLMGRAARSKTSPESRMGSVREYFSVRISRASVNMGVVEGVWRVRGWMVTQSTRRFWGCPMTVSR